MADIWKSLSVILCFSFLLKISVRSDSLLCSSDFCSDYVDKEGCLPESTHCSINNATHTGKSMLSPTPCNCCQYCLPFYGENEHCSLGGPGTGTTVGRCGDGLSCVKHDDGNSYCQRMDTECHRLQDDYDARLESGQVGVLEERPRCDDKGKFGAYACVPTQTCYCQSEEGERIFGEALEGQPLACGCSRLNERIKKSIGSALEFPVIGPRCTMDGNFNPVQCVGKNCYCVNKITGQIVGSEMISLNEKPISALSCYEKDLDINSQQKEEPPYEYTSECYTEMDEKITFIKESIEEGYIMDYFNDITECLPDGTYGRIGKTVNGTKICLDGHGKKLENYEAFPNSPQFDVMNCKCAVTKEVMSSAYEKPTCCANGNFREVQCRRSRCRCVDQDGRQIGADSEDVTKLKCYNDDWKTC